MIKEFILKHIARIFKVRIIDPVAKEKAAKEWCLREYEKIKQKKSKLPLKHRARIIEAVER